MKASSATSARAETAAIRPTVQSSARPRPTPTRAEGFALAGASNTPDPAYNAYRKDLADVALAGAVIASHYAEPVMRKVSTPAELRESSGEDGAEIRLLEVGEPFAMLDDSLGWAWGYAGSDGRVGYVASSALIPA